MPIIDVSKQRKAKPYSEFSIATIGFILRVYKQGRIDAATFLYRPRICKPLDFNIFIICGLYYTPSRHRFELIKNKAI